MGDKEYRGGRFKEKGSGILGAVPRNVSEFLGDKKQNREEQDLVTGTAEKHIDSFTQKGNCTNSQLEKCANDVKNPNLENPDEVERLHVHIRKDLADKLMEIVFRQKRDRNMKKGRASQRKIVEEALEEYFSQHRL